MIFKKDNSLIFAKYNLIFLGLIIEKKRSTMGKLMVVGLRELLPLVGAYRQFISRLWNVFFRLK